MRPTSIIWFERLFLAAIVVGLVNSLLILNGLDVEAAGQPLSPTVMIGSIVIGNVINLALWYMVARRASNVARWILVVLFALGAASLAFSVLTGSYPGGIEGALGAVAWALQVLAIICLFRSDTSVWFHGEEADDQGEIAR